MTNYAGKTTSIAFLYNLSEKYCSLLQSCVVDTSFLNVLLVQRKRGIK